MALLNRDVQVNANGETVDSQGNSTAHTITPIFDQQKVARELNAAVTITQAFSQVAPKAVGDYASGKLQEATDKLILANDPDNGINGVRDKFNVEITGIVSDNHLVGPLAAL